MVRSYPYAVFEEHYGTGQRERPHSVHTSLDAAKAEADRMNRKYPAGVVNDNGGLNGFGFGVFHWRAGAKDWDFVDSLTRIDY